MSDSVEQIAARRLDVGLEEMMGRAAPPDLTAAIRHRLTSEVESRGAQRWLVAAIVLLGVAATWAIAAWPEAPHNDPVPAQDQTIPAHRDVTKPADIAALPIKTVHVRGHLLKDGELGGLTRLTALRFLDLSRCHVTDACFATLAKLHKLEVLWLNGQRVRGHAFGQLLALPNLARVELRKSSVDERGLAALAKLPALRQLDLSNARFVTDAGMQHVLQMRGLQHLELAHNGQLGEGLLLQLGALTQLRHLGVSHIRGANQIRLRGIEVETKTGDAVGVDDRVLAVIAKRMPHLESLDITGCFHVTDKGVRQVLGLPRLRDLRLARCNELTNRLALELAARKGWRRLGLATANLEALRRLAKEQTGLRELELTGERDVALDLRPLVALPELRSLALHRANVRDTDVLALELCPKLEYILVHDDCQRTAWNRLVGHVLVTYSEHVGQYVTFKR